MTWAEIPGYENYLVSDEGEVCRKSDGLIMKQYLQKSGYVYVWLDRGYGSHSVPVHRLVCEAFHGSQGKMDDLYVDHIDTNRANNRADNLHWVTPKENANNPITKNKRKKK